MWYVPSILTQHCQPWQWCDDSLEGGVKSKWAVCSLLGWLQTAVTCVSVPSKTAWATGIHSLRPQGLEMHHSRYPTGQHRGTATCLHNPLCLLSCITFLDQGLSRTGALQKWSQILYRLVRLTPVPTPRLHMSTLFCKSNEYWHILIRAEIPLASIPVFWDCSDKEKHQDQKAQKTAKVASLWHRRF